MPRGKHQGGLRGIFGAAYKERFGARYLGRVLHDVLKRSPAGASDGEPEQVEILTQAFQVFDRNNDGFVCVQELQLVLKALGLKEGRHLKKCQQMIDDADADGDGKLNFEEFKTLSRLMRP